MRVADLYAGVDGGGTSTTAVVVDAAGQERGRGSAGPSNYAAVGRERAVAQIGAALRAATDAAGGGLPVAAAWVGLAGVGRAGDADALLPRLRAFAPDVRLTNDAELALGALPGARGVALIAGTGSLAFGRDASGATARAGGWGHLIGDEGSGYDLGRAALQAAMRAHDGRGPATVLLPAVLASWQLDNPAEIVARVYPAPDKAVIAGLATLVFASAAGGDAVARELLRVAATELARAALAAGAALDFPGDRLPLALVGGLLTHQPAFRAMVLRRIRRRRALAAVALVTDPALTAARAIAAAGAGGPD